jgi:eukaryotic-like serine/threonine-protein kinase
VRTCLAKDPDDRWQTAHDIAVQLRWIQEGGSAIGPAPSIARRRTVGRVLPWIVAALATAGFAALLVRDRLRPLAALPVTRFSILPPEKTIFTPPGELSSSQFALSPDGRSIAFVANSNNGRPLLWVRSFGSFQAAALNGTEDALHPFWSPDSRFIAYFTPTALKKVEVSGGAPQKLCDAVAGRGGTWNSTGVILFTHSANTPIFRVSETGGEGVPATVLDAGRSEDRHRYPVFLPDGKRFLYWARAPRTDQTGVYVASLDSPNGRLVVKAQAMGLYAAGRLLTVQQGTLVSFPFDEKAARVTGPPTRIADTIPTGNPPGYAPFSVAGREALAFSSPLARSRQLMWFDRSGRRLGTVGEAGDYSTPRLSPDGKKLAVAIREESKSDTDLWLFDFSRQTWSRFTFDPATERAPLWSPDGRRIVFTVGGINSVLDLYEKPASGSGEPRLAIGSSLDKFPTDWSHDGRFVVYHTFGGKTFWDIWVAPMDGGKPFPFLATKYTEVQGQISSDGRWMAYTSDESGRLEIYVTGFPDKHGRWQISSTGGTQPWWRGDGKEIFYLGPDQTLMSVSVEAGDSFESGVPTKLFKASFPMLIPAYWGNYSVSPDGQRFLVSELVTETASTPINVVLNWTAAPKK